MNSQSRNRLLQSLKIAPNRHAYAITPSLPFRPHGPATSLSQPYSSKACLSSLQPAAEDIHIPKKRRYSSQAESYFRHHDKQWVEQDRRRVGSGRLVSGRGDMPATGRGDRVQQDDNGSIIVTTSRHSFRDRQGRPWTKDGSSANQGEGAGVGAAAPGVGVGVGIRTPSAAKRKKPRIELRDLSVKPKKKELEPWQVQKGALEKKFGNEGWNPRKKLSPDAMDGIRALHEQDPERWSTPVLAEHFKVSPEAIRRILKSKWKPKDEEEAQKRKQRWARRHDRIWDHQAELGLRPKREKDRDVEDPESFDEELRASEMLNIARKA